MRSGSAKVEDRAAASTQDRSAASVTCRGRSRAVIALYCTCGALFALLVVLGFFMFGPQVESDEGSYLLNAASIAGRLLANPPNGYYSGYSLLLFPGFVFSAGPNGAYHFALVVNALLVASIPLALYRLTRQLWPDTDSESAHVVAALAATCYAPMLMLSQHTMSESALACSFAWLLAWTTTTLRTARMTAALAAGACAGFLFLVHARGATMAAPILLATIVHAAVHPRTRRPVAALWLAAIAVAMLHGPLEVAAGRDSASSAGMLHAMLSRIASPANWKWLPLNFIGSATEAIVTSLGVMAVAVLAIAGELRRAWLNGERLPLRATMLAASAVAMLVALGVTAAFFTPPDRADQIAYGRYALPTLIPLLAIGLLHLITRPDARKRELFWTFVMAIAGLFISAIAYGGLPPAAQANWNFVNALYLYLFHDIFSGIAHAPAPWLSIALCFTAFASVLGIAWLRSVYAGAASYAILQLTVFAAAWSMVTWPGSRLYASDRGVVDAVRAFADAGGRRICVRLGPGVDSWHQTDITWRLFPQIVAASKKDCMNATIDRLDREHAPDQRLAAFERPSPLGNKGAIGLFVHAGADFEDFARVVATPSEDELRPVAAKDRRADVVIADPLSLHAIVGEPVDIHVRVINRSQRALPAPGAAPEFFSYPIQLGAEADLGGKHLEYRAVISEAVAPGGAIDAIIRVGPFDQAGRYALRVGVLQESVAWYEGAARTTLEVSPRQP